MVVLPVQMQLYLLLTMKADHNSERWNKIITSFDACFLLLLFCAYDVGICHINSSSKAVSMALIDVLKAYPNILKIAKHCLCNSHWILFLN